MPDAAVAAAPAPTPTAAIAPAAAPSATPTIPLAEPAALSPAAPEGPGNLIADAAPEAKPEAEVKPEADAKPADTKDAPIYPDLKLPEGLKADDAMLTSFKADAQEAGLTPEQAQKLVDKYGGKIMPADAAKTALDASNNLWKDTQKQWQDSVKSDPEVGGQNLTTNLASIAKLIDSLGGEQAKEIREAFNFTGAGNNPSIVRLLFRAAKQVNTEGRTITGGKPTGTTFATHSTRLYGGGES